MNKVHSVIWSKAQNAWVVVAEGTMAVTKSSTGALKVIIALIMLSPAAGIGATLPQGGSVTIGQGTISSNGSNQMVIKQTSDKLGINWQSFDVGADGHVIFDQPGKNSVALNRVIGSDGSAILGKIDANGQVILINPNGVVFGKDAKVNVGGLMASTLDISDADFKNGDYKLAAVTGKDGEVVNNGTLQAAEGGYIALLGKSVKNNGVIRAQLGSAAMAAGDAMTLDFSGDGLINVQVTKSAVKALVDNHGLIQADGGSVLMTARATNALMDTVVNNDGVIQAQTINSKSGKIFLDGGPIDGSGVVMVDGTLDASAPVSGNGGFIETSGKEVQIKEPTIVTTKSIKGEYGTWLIDPTDMYIVSGSNSNSSSQAYATTIQNALASGNVTLTTSTTGTLKGDIYLNSNLKWSADTTLTLRAHNNIYFGSEYSTYNIDVLGTNGKLALEYGLNGLGNSGYYFSPTSLINLTGANSSFSVNGVGYTVIRTLADLQAISAGDMSGKYALGGNLSASATSSWNSGLGWDPLGSSDSNAFTGLFEGLGHSVTGLTIKRPTQDNVGLFGYAKNATIRNIKVTGTVSGKNNVGLLVGSSVKSVVSGAFTPLANTAAITVSGTSKGSQNVGGVVGYAEDSVIQNATSAAVLTGVDSTGGVVGYANGGTLSYIKNSGAITGQSNTGGLVGKSSLASTTYSSNSGAISGITNTGGIYGHVDGGAHSSNFSTGSVTGTGINTGGYAGEAVSASISQGYTSGLVKGPSSVGGLVGSDNHGTYSQIFSISNVTATGSGGAGFIGSAIGSSINDAYSTGDVTSPSGSAGFITEADGVTVNNAYSTGKAANGFIKKAAAGAASTVTNSYWDTDKSITLASDYGVGKTTAQMRSSSTYSGWNLNNTGASGATWRIYNGLTNPLLTFMMGPASAATGGGSVVYNGTDITGTKPWQISFSYSYTGTLYWQADQTQTWLIGSSSGPMRNAGTYDVTAYSTQFGYNVVQTGPITATITPLALTATVNGTATKTYDGTVTGPAMTASLSGKISADAVSASVAATYSDKNAGTGKSVNYAITLTGADAGNYTLASSTASSTAGIITKKALTITATGANKTYDGTTTANVMFGDNRIAGDDISVTKTGAAFSNKNAGSGKSITISGVTVGGADAGNYSFTAPTTATATIWKALLSVTATTSSKVYDGTTAATTTLSDDRAAGDVLTVSSSGTAFANKNAGTGKTVNVSGITLSGADAANYTLGNTSASSVADITKAALSIGLTAGDKVYDGTTAATVGYTDNRIAGDVLSISSSGATFADKNAGNGKSISVSGITVTGADSANYSWNASAGKLANITKANLVISAVASDKQYDATNAATATLSDNRVSGDSFTISSSSATFSDKNAGAGKAVTVSGLVISGADADNYNWNALAATTATISKRTIGYALGGGSKTYDGNDSATGSLTLNTLPGDVVTATPTGHYATKNANAWQAITFDTVTYGGADVGNYVLPTAAMLTGANGFINPKALTIGMTAGNKTYDGNALASASFTDDRIPGDNLTISSTSTTFANKNAGNGKTVTASGISVTGVDAGNYTWSTSATALANIMKAVLSISATASDKTYDGTALATTSFADNRVAGDVLTLGSATSTFADKNAGANKTVTASGITVTGADASNYTWGTTASTTATINKASLLVSAIANDKIYDGLTTATTSLSDNRVAGDILNVSATGSNFADKNAGSGKTVNVTGINVTGADAGNYAWNASTATLASIGKANLVVAANASNKTYDGSTAATVSLSDNRIGSDALVISSSASSFSDKNAGNGKTVTTSGINVTGADAANYNWNVSAASSANIAKASLVISAVAQDKIYDGTTAATTTLSDNRVAGDVLNFSSSSSFVDKNAGAGKTVNVSGIGVTGADAANYAWNATAVSSATINKASLLVSATGVDKTYNGSTAATVALHDNRIAGDNLTISGASNFIDKNAGTGKTVNVSGITLAGADANNYVANTSATTTANIAKANLVVSAVASDKTYDGLTTASTVLSDNRIAGDNLAISATGSSFADKNAGAGKTVTVGGISVTGSDAGNYLWNGNATTTASINKAVLNVAAHASDKVYDGNALASTTLSDDRVSGDNLVLGNSSSAFSDKNAGAGKAVTVGGITVTGADAANYLWNATASTTASISKASLVISAVAANKAYDGTTAASTVLSDNRISGDSLVLSSTSNFSDKNAGAGKTVNVSGITVTGADAANYNFNTSATTTATISKAILAITAHATDKVYDGNSNAAISLTDNRVLGDTLVLGYAGSAFSDKNAGSGKTVTVSGITLTGIDAGNYTWNANASTLANISKANLVIGAVASDKTYDGSALAATTLSDNRIAGDDLVFSSSSAFSDKNAGAGKTVTVSGIGVTGADAANYSWNAMATTSATIHKASLLVSATASNRTYDGSASASTQLSDNRISGDDLVIGSTSAFSDKNAGTGKTVTVSGIALSGADAGNYTVNTSTTATADIAKAVLAVTAHANDKIYDGSANATTSLTDNRIAGDSLVLSSAGAAFSDKNAGSGKAVTVSGLNVTGADAGNYLWGSTATTTASIAKASLVISAVGQDKTYDGTTLATTLLSDNRVSGDDLSIASSASFADKNAGAGKTITVGSITVTGADAANYSWNATAATSATINKASLIVSATGNAKTYDGNTSASTNLSDNRIAGDDLALSASSSFVDKNAGTNKTINVTGITLSGADANNYNVNGNAVTTADINKANLVISATASDKAYDGLTTASTSLTDNRILGDNLIINHSGSTFADKNAGSGKTVTVSGLSVTGTDASNYNWNLSALTSAAITKAVLNIAAHASDKVYDGNNLASTTLSDDRVAGDSLVIGNTSSVFADKNAGNGKAVTVAGISVSGADAGNYAWLSTTSTTANISKAMLNVTATASGKVYDGTSAATTTLQDNRVAGDDLTLNGVSNFADKNAQIGKTVIVNGINVTGADAGNYLWNASAGAVADITKASLAIAAHASDKVYDGTTAASTSLTDNRIGSDDLVITKSGSVFSDKNAGTGKTVTVSGLNVTGTDASNYTWNAIATDHASIAKANLLISASGVDKTYDGSVAATSILGDDRIAGDSLVISGLSSFADKNAGIAKAITVNGISVTGTDAANYSWNVMANTAATINKATLLVSATGSTKTYDGTTAAVTALHDDRVSGDSLVLSGTSNFADKNAGAGKAINVSGITIGGADAGNYVANTSASTIGTINKANLTISATASDRVYDGSASASVSLTDNRISGDSLSIGATGSNFSDKNAGIGKTVIVSGLNVTGVDALNYDWNMGAVTSASISKAILNVAAHASDKVYDGSSAASASLTDDRILGDNLTVSNTGAAFADKNAGVNKTVTVGGITLSGTDASNYIVNSSAGTTATINKANLVISASAVDKTYDGTAAANAVLTDNRISGDDLVIGSSAGMFSDKNAGSGKTVTVGGITISGSDAGNYLWNASAYTSANIARAALTVSAVASDKTYDGLANASTALHDNRIAGDDLVLSSTGSNFSDKNAGSNKTVTVGGISISGADAGNYFANTTASTSASIAKAALNVTAVAAGKTYDGTTSASTTLLDNRVSGDDLNLSSSSSSFADKNAGAGKTVTVGGIAVTGSDAANYTWNALANTTADINKANLLISASGVSKTYDGTTAAGVILSDNRISGDSLAIGSAGSTFSDKNAGNGKSITVNGLTVSGIDAGNYNWNSLVTATADIAKAALVVSATANDKTYDGSALASTLLQDDRIVGDNLIVSAGSSTFSDKNAGTNKTVNVGGITISGADANNYITNTSTATTASINKAALVIGATAAGKTYDGTTNASTALNDNRISGDDLVIGSIGSTFDSKNAGNGKTVTVSGLSVSGSDAGNYLWNSTASTTADIAKAALVISAAAGSKTYDGNTSASTTLGDNRVSGDDLTITSAGSYFSDKNAGALKSVTVNGITVTGADSQNYTYNTQAFSTADIAKAMLNVSATASDKTYDGSKAASTTLHDNRVAGDNLTLSFSDASFADKNAGALKTVTINGISISGADAMNYEVNTSASTLATIDKAALVIGANASGKVYDASTAAHTTLTDNRVAGDDLVIAGSGSNFADKNAGANKVVTVDGMTVSGADAANYFWNGTAHTTATIEKASLQISAQGSGKIYDGSTHATVALSDDRITGDDLAVAASGATFSDKNAGNGKLVTVAGITLSGADAQNYTYNTVTNTTADIAKASLAISASGINKTYDGTTNASVSFADNRVVGDDLSIGSTATFNDKNAGSGKAITVSGISVTGADAGNYLWSAGAVTSADIAKANLLIGAIGSTKTYDGTKNAVVTLTDNRIAGDDLVVAGGQAIFADKNAGNGKAVTVGALTVSGSDASNYEWNSQANTSANIAKANLLVSASAGNKVYDGSTGATVTLSDNRIGSDDIQLSSSNASFSDKNAGANKAVTTGVNVTGADAQNYNYNSLAVTTAEITKAFLRVYANASGKTYDGNDVADVAFTDNRVSGDSLEIGSKANTFSDQNAGSGKIVTSQGITLSGADAGNYSFDTTLTSTADIAKAKLVVGADAASKLAGAADGALGWKLKDGQLFGTDVIEGRLERASGEDVGTYAIGKGSLTAGDNYDMTVAPGVFSILKQPAPAHETKPDQTKEIVSAISLNSPEPKTATTAPITPGRDYRLVNLGMRMPDEMSSDEE
jgi:filamentous hemagglutinin family protein